MYDNRVNVGSSEEEGFDNDGDDEEEEEEKMRDNEFIKFDFTSFFLPSCHLFLTYHIVHISSLSHLPSYPSLKKKK